jgi:Family of unknown function (DUF6521)
VTPWKDRPREFAHLLNPAFLGLLVVRASAGYTMESTFGLPFPLVFLALPIVLHRSTRDRLPRTIATKLTVWLEDLPEVRVGFPERVRALAPYAREGVRFALARDAVRLTGDARLTVPDGAPARRELRGEATDEVNECLARANFVGRWLTGAGSMSTTFAIWGIRP